MVALRLETPATFDDCLRLAPPTRTARKVTMFMRLTGDTAAVYAGEDLVSVVCFMKISDTELQFYPALARGAEVHLLKLIRLAHLTFARISQTNRIVSTIIRPGHKPGERLARLTGFRPDTDTPEKWIWSARDRHDDAVQRESQKQKHRDGRRTQEPGSEPDRARTSAATGK